MAYTSYATDDRMIVGGVTNGVMRNYQLDALGSVVGTILNGVAENTYRYTPYGGVGRKTGSAADPSFLWNGGSGYRASGLAPASHSVRRRHYSDVAAQWTTTDGLWPLQAYLGYSKGNPANLTDPT